jgi:hypothetical protein
MPNPIAMIDYQKCNPERCDKRLPTNFLFRARHASVEVVPNVFKYAHLRQSE